MSESEKKQKRSLVIPLWVAFAGMILAFILAIIIMANVLKPLVNLVFPSDPQPPVPPDAVVLEDVEEPLTSTDEWLYGTHTDACDIAEFYIDEGSTCRYSPFVCGEDDREFSETTSIAVCTGTKSDVINSYSWEALISAGPGEYETRIRLFLYAER